MATPKASEKRLLHVAIDTASRTRSKEFEGVFDKAKDWFRYAPNCWILWTSVSAERWAARLMEIVDKEHESFLVCEFNFANHQGWLPREAWKWINEKIPATRPSG